MWQRSNDWVGSQIDEQFVMVHIDSGKYLALNPTANLVWQRLEQPASEQQLVDSLTQQFDVSVEDCHRSVGQLLARMQDMGLVSPV